MNHTRILHLTLDGAISLWVAHKPIRKLVFPYEFYNNPQGKCNFPVSAGRRQENYHFPESLGGTVKKI